MELQVTYRSELELLTCKTPTTELKYRVFQIYGQKYVKLLNITTDPAPSTEVFVSNIPRSLPIDTIFRFFAQCGEIYQIRLLMDFSGSNRGKCFVQYMQVWASREAICCLHDEDITMDHRIVVKLSLNNNQLILRSIPEWMSEQYVRDVVVKAIGEGLTGITIKKSRVPFKNYCFCTYRDHQFAIMAHKKSWPFLNIAGMVIDVHWAVPKLLRCSTNLYFTNFSLDMTKKEFFDALAGTIDVKTLVQFRIGNSYGYITFINYKAMAKAENEMKSLTIRGLKMNFSQIPFRNLNHVKQYSPDYFKDIVPVAVRDAVPTTNSMPFFGCYTVPNQPPRLPVNVPFFMPHVPAFAPYPFYNPIRMLVSYW